MIAQAKCWAIVIFAAFIVAGCGGTDSNNQLKPPSVYRDPRIHVTRAPTEIAVDLSTIEASASPTADALATQPLVEPLVDEEQFLMDNIEYLLDKIQRKLDQTDLNP